MIFTKIICQIILLQWRAEQRYILLKTKTQFMFKQKYLPKMNVLICYVWFLLLIG